MSPDKTQENDDNRESFVRLLTRHDRSVRAYLRSILFSNSDVDEVMQEVSVVAWRKFDELEGQDNFPRWMCGIAKYEALMYRRKHARDRLVFGFEVEQLIADEGAAELALRQQQLDALEGCIENLTDERKQLVREAYSADQTMKAIAAQIGKTPEAVYKTLSRIRIALMGCVEKKILEAGQ